MMHTAHLFLYFILKFTPHHWKKKSIFRMISLSPPYDSAVLRVAHHPIPACELIILHGEAPAALSETLPDFLSDMSLPI